MLIVFIVLFHAFAAVFLYHANTTVAAQGVSIPLIRVPVKGGLTPHVFSSNVSLYNSQQFAYLAHINIGNQNFLVLLDTGSSDLWVVSSECSDQDCSTIAKYRPSPSLNLTDTVFALEYLLGSVSGRVGTETVTLGPFQIEPQVFALADKTMGLGLSGTGNSGILGLSFPLEASISATAGSTLLENILSPFEDSDKYFAFKLGRDQFTSSFTVGQVDSTYANSPSDFAFTPVYPAYGSTYDYWKLPITYFTINSTRFELSKSRVPHSPTPLAVLDTGTTLVLGPPDDVERFYQSVGGARKNGDGWQIRCDRGIIIGFALGQGDSLKEYVIDPSDIAWEEGGREGDWCYGGIQANDEVSSGDWLLGDTFLRNVYVIHHAGTSSGPPSVGLLGMTDATKALEDFRVLRGNDPTPPSHVITHPGFHMPALTAPTVCGISGVSGLLFGAIVTGVVFACQSGLAKRRATSNS
ncbi:peptidase A1 family protein [Abortiporus biennis]